MRKKWTRFIRRIRPSVAWLLLFFNILLVFVPVASFLSLKTYEKGLLDSLEQALMQQARFLSAWLSSASLDRASASSAVASLQGNHTARVRVVDTEGLLLADSSSFSPQKTENPLVSPREIPKESPAPVAAPEESWVYQLFSQPARWVREFILPSPKNLESADYYGTSPSRLMGSEIQAALEGRYGATTRYSSGGQVSVTLYSAVPVYSPNESGPPTSRQAVGAVLVSQSTFRILTEIYDLRVQVAKIFLISLAAALCLTLIVSFFVLRPIRALSRQARTALTLRGIGDRPFSALKRKDEIGELSQALSQFSLRLKDRLEWAERFSQDASHELKNPIASIRAAAELLEGSNEEERLRIAATIGEEAYKMERIVEGLRRLSRLDSDRGEVVELSPIDLVRNTASRHSRVDGVRLRVIVSSGTESERLLIDPDRLVIALDNLIDNALSFSPPDGEVLVTIARAQGGLEIAVEDSGPGIPEENLEKLFNRFFSYRSAQSGDDTHAGLGLSIALAVAKGSGGSIRAENRESGGARFVISLPTLKTPK